MEQIDVMRTSASRPNFLKISTESLIKNLKFSGRIRFLIHEDCLNRERSEEVMKYVEECGIYDVAKSHNPPLGQGGSLTWLLGKVQTRYVLNFEDDFELKKEVNVDRLWELMDKHRDINQIAFHKRPIMSEKPNFKKKHIVREGIDLVTNPHWAFTPSMFRLDFIRPKWINFNIEIHWKMNEILKGGKRLYDADWVMQHTGTYFLGRWKNKKMLKENGGTMTKEEYDAIDEGYYSEHLGKDNSVRLGTYAK